MTAFLVTLKDDVRNLISFHLEPLGFHVRCFGNPLVVIDHLAVELPDLILFHSGDFPRQWKPLLVILRQRATRETSVFVLVTGADFEPEEAAKASHLGANGLLREDLSEKELIQTIKDIYRRYRPLKEKRNFRRLVPGNVDKFGFLFTHPRKAVILAGHVSDVSLQGIAFRPLDPTLTSDLRKGEQIKNCSMRVGDHIIAVNCRVARNREEMGLQFESFGPGDHHLLLRYVNASTERKLAVVRTPDVAKPQPDSIH